MTTMTPQNTSMQQTLTVMNVVDQLRYDDATLTKKTDEVLSDDALRAHVIKVYADNGITVTDELVAKAIVAYRAKEFSFTPAKEGWERSVAMLYVTRDRWMGKALLGVSAAFVLTVGGIGAKSWSEGKHYRDLQAQVQTSNTEVADQVRRITALQNDVSALRTNVGTRQREWQSAGLWSSAYVVGAADTQEGRLNSIEASVRSLKAAQAPKTIDDSSTLSYSKEVSANKTRLDTIASEVASVKTSVEGYGTLVALEGEYRGLVKEAKVKGALRTKLDGFATQAQAAFSQGNLQEATVLTNSTRELVANSGAMNTLLDTVASLRAELNGSWRDDSVKTTVEPMLNRADAVINGGDVTKARGLIKDIQDTMAFARTELAYTIVVRSGVATGTSRKYKNDDSTKIWYLIAEALDASGEAFTVPVSDTETGTVQRQKMFGVSVNKKLFDAVRDEKKRTGLVRNKILGVKPAGTLKVEDKLGMTGDFIVKW